MSSFVFICQVKPTSRRRVKSLLAYLAGSGIQSFQAGVSLGCSLNNWQVYLSFALLARLRLVGKSLPIRNHKI